jgi:hypothetical protein
VQEARGEGRGKPSAPASTPSKAAAY